MHEVCIDILCKTVCSMFSLPSEPRLEHAHVLQEVPFVAVPVGVEVSAVASGNRVAINLLLCCAYEFAVLSGVRERERVLL